MQRGKKKSEEEGDRTSTQFWIRDRMSVTTGDIDGAVTLFAYQGAHVKLLDGDVVDDDGRLIALVESVGQHCLCLLNELFGEVRPLEAEGHCAGIGSSWVESEGNDWAQRLLKSGEYRMEACSVELE